MSIFKRKASSLDPIQKQRKNKQVQYFILLDKCLQIPNDDKMIVRKGITEYQQSIISLLEKYRKQGPKDLKDLQIFLRRYIQKYKSQHPKYPTLKLSKESQSFQSLQKRRASMTLSINASKISCKVNNNKANNSKISNIEQKQIKTISDYNKFSRLFYKEEQRNYQKLIQKRKAQKLQISHNRVSVTIQNESNFKKKQVKQDMTTLQSQSQFLDCNNEQKCKIVKSLHTDFNQIYHNVSRSVFQHQQFDNNEQNKFLQTMRFNMQEQQPKINQIIQYPTNLALCSQTPQKIQSIVEAIISANYLNQNQQSFQAVKKKLFLNHQNNAIAKYQKQKQFEESKILQRQPLRQRNSFAKFNNQNTLISQNLMNSKLSSYSHQKQTFSFQQEKNCINKENLNSGKNNADKKDTSRRLTQLTNKQKENQFFMKFINSSQKKQKESQHLNSLSTICKQTQQNQPTISYLSSHRKKSVLFSHRLPVESGTFLNNSIDTQNKQSKSSRMMFSHRMQQVISGRKQSQEEESSKLLSPLIKNSSHSFRQSKRSGGKLQFWARIQSTINQ